MGSKKLKKKKVKKLDKFHKSKKIKQKKTILSESLKELNCEKSRLVKNINNRLSLKERSRSCDTGINLSSVEYFSKVREDYFSYLQTVICDNCVFYDSLVTEKVLENLALELEQNALLACLQVDIYRNSMLEIIKDIKKSTEEGQMHKDVKKLLPDSTQENSVSEKTVQTNITDSATTLGETEVFNKIPTIASTRTCYNIASKNDAWESNYNQDSYYLVPDGCQETYSESQHGINGFSWVQEGSYALTSSQSNYWYNEFLQTSKSDIDKTQNVTAAESSVKENNFSQSNQNDCTEATTRNKTKEKCDPLSASRNQLQKSVEQTLIQTERINKHKQEEQERAHIAQILEGDNSLDDKFNDSLSDNENESKENIDESNLMDRLEKMRELFGLEEEESQTEFIPKKQKQSNKIIYINNRSRRPTIWKYEKFIQFHKYSIIAAEMTLEKKELNRKIFIELFGEDSDEEHEIEYLSTEKYKSSCSERISSWVVKYLMPFYHEKRILGRDLFKSLGHFISDTIVDKIEYPDEWTVKYFVSKFFPPKKKYVCDADILNFQLT